MKRRAFLRSGLAATILGPQLITSEAFGSSVAPASIPAGPGLRNDLIRLNLNENALGMPESARRAIAAAVAEAHRYPDTTPLIEKVAQTLGVKANNMLFGGGSTDLIRVVVHAAVAPGNLKLITADPAYGDPITYAAPFNIPIERVPLTTGNFAHDLERMVAAAKAHNGPSILYICNPNNPTGTLTPSADVDRAIQAVPENVWVVVDEAYFEYANDPSFYDAVRWVDSKPNVVVLRTFSKIFAMAGLRVGYAVAHPDTIRKLGQFGSRNNLNALSIAAGMAAWDDKDYIARSIRSNAEAKQILVNTLKDLDIAYLPSHTNFMMHRITGDLQDHIRRMREHNVAIGRPFPPMLTYSRVTIGLPSEMEKFTEVLRSFRRAGVV